MLQIAIIAEITSRVSVRPMESLSRIKLYQLMLRRQLLPATFVFIVVLAITVLGISFRKPNYLAEGTLKFERTSPTSSLTGVGKETGNLVPLVEKSSPVATESEVIRSTPVIQDTITQLDLCDREGSPLKPRQFSKRLTVAEVRGTDILKISYKDPDPGKAATVVNTVIAVYLKRNALSRQAQATRAREFIEQELPAAEATVNQAETNLQRFKKNHQVVDLKEEATTAVSMQTNLQEQIAAVQTQIADAKTQAQIFQKKLGTSSQEVVNLTAISQSLGVQEALAQFQRGKLQQDLTDIYVKYLCQAAAKNDANSVRLWLKKLVFGYSCNNLDNQVPIDLPQI